MLGEWGKSVGHSLRLDAAAAGGITPLHLLAVLLNSGELAVALTGALLFLEGLGRLLWLLGLCACAEARAAAAAAGLQVV